MRRPIALMLLSLCVACGSSPNAVEDEPTGTQASATTTVSGNWALSMQCTDSPDPSAPDYVLTACNGVIQWTGTFTGSSPFVAHSWPHLPTGTSSFFVNTWTFTGTGLGTSGSFSMNGGTMTWDPPVDPGVSLYGVVTATSGGFVRKMKVNTSTFSLYPGTGDGAPGPNSTASGTYTASHVGG